jgi:hypothetical protein
VTFAAESAGAPGIQRERPGPPLLRIPPPEGMAVGRPPLKPLLPRKPDELPPPNEDGMLGRLALLLKLAPLLRGL